MRTKVEQMYRNWPQIPEIFLKNSTGEFVRLMDHPYNPSVDVSWICSQLENTVRLGTGAEALDVAYPSPRDLPYGHIENISASQFEESIIFPSESFFKTLQQKGLHSGYFGVSEQILTILLSNTFRSGTWSQLSPEYLNFLHRRVLDSMERSRSIELVIPTIPFKDQNPFTTGHSLSFTDLGEYLFFSRLGRLSRSVGEIYPMGLQTHLISDGIVYRDIFLSDQAHAPQSYIASCQRVLEGLGIAQYVDITYLDGLIDLESRFGSVQAEIRTILGRASALPEHIQEILRSLRRGMIFNMEMPLGANGYDEFSYIVNLGDSQMRQEYPEVFDRSWQAALDYSSFLLAMKKLDIVSRAFPLSIRGTVHPKPNQLGIWMVQGSSIAPYNGVPVVDYAKFVRTGSFELSTKTQRLWQIYEQENIHQIFLGTDTEPFFYAKNMVT